MEAEIARGLLETHDIKSFVTADDAGGMRPTPFMYKTGVQLMVSKNDLKKAQKLLTAIENT